MEKNLAAEQSLRRDIVKADEGIRQLQQETLRRGLARDAMATMASAVEHELQQYRQQLGASKQADFDVARSLSESRGELQRLQQQREQVENASARPVVIESYPTPLSRAVDGPEAHMLITNGRVTFIPLEPLLNEFQSQARRQVDRLRDEPELTDTVGPVGGFRLQYTLVRHDVMPESPRQRGGRYVRLERWTLIPESNDLGEPVRLALQQGSDFRQSLAKILPGRTTITIWVYPDGFAAFREVRKELYRLGYTVAGRPLPPGKQISGSPEGSKSAAQ